MLEKLGKYVRYRVWAPLNRTSNEIGLFPITSCPLSPQQVAFISHKHKFIYYEVPKAACSSIKFFIVQIDEIKRDRPGIHSLNIPTIPSFEARLTLYQSYFHFTFVRNPYDRLVSCYVDKVHRPALLGREDHLFSDGEYREFLSRYGKLDFKKMSFGDFVRFVNRIPDRHCNRHFMPQNCLLDLDKLDFIGRIENFDQDFLCLRKQIGLSDDAPYPEKLNATEHDPYRTYYDDELREIAARKYARDLEVFNYDF